MKSVFFILSVFLLLLSCSKDKESESSILGTKWERVGGALTDVEVEKLQQYSNESYLISFNECEADDVLEFLSDGKLVELVGKLIWNDEIDKTSYYKFDDSTGELDI